MLGKNMPKVFQCMAGRWKLFKNIGKPPKNTPKRCLTFKKKRVPRRLLLELELGGGVLFCGLVYSLIFGGDDPI